MGDHTTLVLYLSEVPSEEKRPTQAHREGRRKIALAQANHHLQELERRIDGKQNVRRPHFSNVNKNLRTAFVWPLASRQGLADYLISRQWNVILCETEADVKIAVDCHAADIAVSRDSDMLMYSNIKTIWRPISKDRVLVYKLTGVLASLNLDRTQLTVLGIVSKNDYNYNIHSLGSATNYGIIKEQDAGGLEV
ncbi:hypothetical protein EC968_001985 [Mortierella alpina]|nr:hypothetical protein EC968_001985 [Mortierella alpina]